jgi:hypothetical protein
MVFEFTVSKPGFEIDVSRLEQILAQTLRENFSHIARHLKFQFQNSKATASALSLMQSVTQAHQSLVGD